VTLSDTSGQTATSLPTLPLIPCCAPAALPLWATLVALLWAATAVVSASYHSVSIFVMDVQVIAVLGSLNLDYPDWIQRLMSSAPSVSWTRSAPVHYCYATATLL